MNETKMLEDMTALEVQEKLAHAVASAVGLRESDPDYVEEYSEYLDYDELRELIFPWRNVDKDKPFVVPDLGEVFGVQQFGGEGEGDQYWYVLKVVELNPKGNVTRHFKVDGYYQSFNGGEYSDFFEVTPKQKKITVWESKK